ncbi:MAG: DUF3179 domain-containing (seleno)protein [Candidatus Thorarchaeota archaeon]
MFLLLSILAAILAFLGMIIVVLPRYIPRIGVFLLYRVRLKRNILFASAIALSGYSLIANSSLGEIISTFATIGFLFLSLRIRPWMIFRELESTDHIQGLTSDLDDDVLVMGYEGEEGSIAWPVKEMLMPKHIVHDELDGTPLLATYCPACRSGMLFRPEINGKKLSFRVQGIWRRNLVMTDFQTHTLWQQATGEAIYGELKAAKLPVLHGRQMKWGAWKKKNPDTILAAVPKNAKSGIISDERLNRRFEQERVALLPGFVSLGDQVAPREFVYGIVLDGIAKAYRVSDLSVNNEIVDHIGSRELRIYYDPASEAIQICEIIGEQRREIPVERHWWLGWKEFHPDTEVYSI